MTTLAPVPGVPALLPSYASYRRPGRRPPGRRLAAVADLGPRVRVQRFRPPGRAGRSGLLLAEVGADEVVEEPTGVLVVGNGSAKRTLKAPGHLDDRAEVFDDDLRRALVELLPAALSSIDEQLAEELWADVAGIRAFGDLLTPGTHGRGDLRRRPVRRA